MSDSIFDKLTINPAYRVVADAIEQNIVEGRLKVGDRLPAETEIAKQFGVHRSTVREGLRLLEESGLVSRVGRMTLEVRLPHFRELATRASRALSMHQVTFQELWDASMITEPAIAERAAEHISDDELDALKQNIAAMEACGQETETEQFVKLDIEFHDIIARASRNKVFRLMREPISLLFLPAGQTILPTIKTYERVIEAHRKIYQALSARDKVVAQEWMTRHMADFRRGYLRTGANPDKPLSTPSEGLVVPR